jgi:predicted ABC-type exoprotein transport system permease subunit
MNKRKMGFIIFGGLFASWIYLVFPTFLQVFGFTPIVFPNKQFTLIENVGLLCTCLSVAGFSLVLGVEEMKQSYTESDVVGKKLNFHLVFVTCFIILFSTPLAYSYVFEQQQQAMSQTIINLELLDDDFSGHPPGSAPDNWYPLDGNWTLVNDGGNLVYYQ